MPISRLPWKIKPGYRASFNRSNPITRDLLRYWPCASPHLLDDLVVGQRLVPHKDIIQTPTTRGLMFKNTASGDVSGDSYSYGPTNELISSSDTKLTVMCWARFDAPSGTTTRRMITLASDSGSPPQSLFGFDMNESGLIDGHWFWRDGSDTFTEGEWNRSIQGDGIIHHLALTIDGPAGIVRGYIDGELNFENLATSFSSLRGSADAFLGGRNGTTDQCFSTFAEFGIWTRALSSAEVRSLFEDPYQIYEPRSVFMPFVSFGDLIKSAVDADTSKQTFTVDLGSNPDNGNLLIITICSGSSTITLDTPPPGFTLLHISNTGSGTWQWYYKLSDGTEQSVTAIWDASTSGVMRYAEYQWDGSLPRVIRDEDTSKISSPTNTVTSGTVTPTKAKNICIAMHATDGNSNSFTGQAVDGDWIEDFTFRDGDGTQAEGKLSRLVNAPLTAQIATHTDSDGGDQMYGAIAVFVSQVSVRSSARAANSSANSITVNEPAGAAVDDWIIVVVAGNTVVTLSDGNGSTPFVKTNQFQEASQGNTLAIFRRKKEAGDPSTLTFNSTATERIAAVSIAFRDGLTGSEPYDITPSASTADTELATQTHAGKDITTVIDNSIHLAVGILDSGASTFNLFPSGYTEIEVEDGEGQGIAVYSKVITPAGATGQQTFGTSGTVSHMSQSFSIADDAVVAGATKSFTSTFTRHSLHGGARSPYGSFSGKEVSPKIASSPNIMSERVGYGKNATGGKDGTVVSVTNLNDTGAGSLRQAIADASGATWIVFTPGLTGTITLASPLGVVSDLTIDGRGADITIDADKIAGQTNDVNIILLYLKHTGTSGGGDDCWQADMDGSPGQGNWWVHHCTFQDAFDECIGITNAVSDWTISYTRLISKSGLGKAMLAGGSNGDSTTMWGTMHYCWIDALERLPRTRRVKLHMFNNLQEGWTSDNPAANIGDNGQCYYEKNVADANGTGTVALDHASGDPNPGFTKSVGPHHLLNSATVVENTPGSVFDPSTDGPTGIPGYTYIVETADAALKARIEAQSGWQSVPHPGTTAPWDFPTTLSTRIKNITSTGVATAGENTASGSPSITQITSTGVAEIEKIASGSPSITNVTSTGVAEIEKIASGSPEITNITSTGVAVIEKIASGSPEITNITSTGVAEIEKIASGSPSITGITSTGTTIVTNFASGSPSIQKPTSTGTVVVTNFASGAPSITQITSTGVAVIEKIASGSPSITNVTSTGVAEIEKIASGSPSITNVTSTGVSEIEKIASGSPSITNITSTGVATVTVSGGTKSFTVTFTRHALYGGIRPLYGSFVGKEVANLASGAPSITNITSTGVAEIEKIASGAPSITQITSTGVAEIEKIASGSPSITNITSTGVAEIEKIASGAPSITNVTSTGVAVIEKIASGSPSITKPTSTGITVVTNFASGSPSITKPTSTGVAEIEKIASGSPSITNITSTGTAVAGKIASGAPSITNITSTGVAVIEKIASGSPSITNVTSTGTTVVTNFASGAPSITGITSTGVAEVEKIASGSPSITNITSTGVAVIEKIASGSPSITKPTSTGTTVVTNFASGSPSITNITSTGVATVTSGNQKSFTATFTRHALYGGARFPYGDFSKVVTHIASGAPSITNITSTGTTVVTNFASGSPSITKPTSSGVAEIIKPASGAPSITNITSAGTAIIAIFASGTPSIPKPTSTGVAVIEKIASGAPSIPKPTSTGTTVVTNFASGAPSITKPTSAGTAIIEKIASGSPSITNITSTGTAVKADTIATGAPSITKPTSTGVAVIEKIASGSPSITNVTSTGVAIVTGAHTASGSPSITNVTSTGVAKVTRLASGAPSITNITSTGVAVIEKIASGSPAITQITSTGVVVVTNFASGSPSITQITSSGAVIFTRFASGAPTIANITSAGTAAKGAQLTSSGAPSITNITASSIAIVNPIEDEFICRILAVPFEDRALSVSVEDRLVVVVSEDRSQVVTAEDRTHTIECEI